MLNFHKHTCNLCADCYGEGSGEMAHNLGCGLLRAVRCSAKAGEVPVDAGLFFIAYVSDKMLLDPEKPVRGGSIILRRDTKS